MKIAEIRDQADDRFAFEFENTPFKKNSMCLDAMPDERAIREARSFLGIH